MKSKWSKKSIDLATHLSTDEPAGDPDKVHLWLIDLDRENICSTPKSTLSDSENDRVQRLRNKEERRRQRARFAITRQVLGRTVGVHPKELTFVEGVCGKPHLAIPSDMVRVNREVNFNVARSENVMAIGVAFGLDVGVDLEVVDPVKGKPAFYRSWTLREARAKLAGVGIAWRGSLPLLESTSESFGMRFGGRRIAVAIAVSEVSGKPGPYQGAAVEDSGVLSVSLPKLSWERDVPEV